MGGEQQARALPLQPRPNRGDLVSLRLLLAEQVIESEDHQGVGVCQYPLVDRQLVAGLVDALEDRDRVTGHLAGQFLEVQRRTVEQLQSARDALEEVRLIPLR